MMDDYHRQSFDNLRPAPRERHCHPVPAGVKVLSNSCVAPGSKLLGKERREVAVLRLDAPTETYDFDMIIVSPDDIVAALSARRDRQ